MSKKIRRSSNLKIYVTYYLMFLLGAILFILGLYTYDRGALISEDGGDGRGLENAGIIFIVLGVLFVFLSFIYSRRGARVIGVNCPYCHGTGYVDAGRGKKARTEMCPVCDGTGKMYDKTAKQLLEEKKHQEKEISEKKEDQKSEEEEIKTS
ncbi:MAG: hypothetical protein ACXAAM_05105 [Candidatus Heimdallarchaeaceae archaeon]|jgi:hypothetical protein